MTNYNSHNLESKVVPANCKNPAFLLNRRKTVPTLCCFPFFHKRFLRLISATKIKKNVIETTKLSCWSAVKKNIAYVSEHLSYCTQTNIDSILVVCISIFKDLREKNIAYAYEHLNYCTQTNIDSIFTQYWCSIFCLNIVLV